jgi:hypothetical protein
MIQDWNQRYIDDKDGNNYLKNQHNSNYMELVAPV